MSRRGVLSSIERFFQKHRERRYIHRRALTQEYFFSLGTARLLSSRGLVEVCDVHPDSPRSSFVDEVYVRSIADRCADVPANKDTLSIYLCTDAIPLFVDEVLLRVNRPFVLVTGDSDTAVSTASINNIDALLSHVHFKRWFAQNLQLSHPKVEPMPIGLDYHSAWQDPRHYGGRNILPALQEAELRAICRTAKSFSQRKTLAVCDWLGRSAYGDREEARVGISEGARYVPEVRLPRYELWKKYTEYAFVASPSGVGLDCHRTWEAIALGCVPIIKTSAMSRLFDGMPVLEVDAWSKVTPEFLGEQHKHFLGKDFDYSKLFLTSWLMEIQGFSKPAKMMVSIDNMIGLI